VAMLFDQMMTEKFEGFFAWGQNPDCSGANSNKTDRRFQNSNGW